MPCPFPAPACLSAAASAAGKPSFVCGLGNFGIAIHLKAKKGIKNVQNTLASEGEVAANQNRNGTLQMINVIMWPPP